MLATLTHWWQAYGDLFCALLVALLPTLIVGLRRSHASVGVIGLLEAVLYFLSVVTHRDEPGTFKPPFTRRRRKAKAETEPFLP